MSDLMKAMIFDRPGALLRLDRIRSRDPGEGEILIRVRACGVCRTDLHVVDGELPAPKTSLVPGHEIVGVVEAVGRGVTGFRCGDRVGVPWLGWTCGTCRYCANGRENLCDNALFTGYTLDGGYAERVTADASYCFRIPDGYSDIEAAPLLCAGLIGYRALAMAKGAQRVGFYGFGAAAHIAVQVARHCGQDVYAFTRPGDAAGQSFARSLGAVWAGGSDVRPPRDLDAAIIFAPVGALVPAALSATVKGGIVICAGIHMTDIPALPYELLWGERSLCSVANLTRRDGEAFFAIAGAMPIHTSVQAYPLAEANAALSALRAGLIKGAGVLVP
jgi:propanol-preferring alcohol dehydrogenase